MLSEYGESLWGGPCPAGLTLLHGLRIMPPETLRLIFAAPNLGFEKPYSRDGIEP